MRVHYEVCCGIDVHKNSVTACLMRGPANREPQSEIRRFGTMTADLKNLAAWLADARCEVAVMESTGAYWKPVWNILESHVKLVLANARHVRALPGEKTDNKDGKRLASLMRHGLIRPSFIPPRDIRELRDLTRYRKKLLANGSAERNRIQKTLEDANIKLGSVLTDMFGVSGQRILQELVKGESIDGKKLAELAHWSLQPKMEALKKSLEGRLTRHHRFMVEVSLDHMAEIEKHVMRLDQEIAEHLKPYQRQLELLQTIPGIGENGATRKGNPHLTSSMVECAWAATRKKNSRFKSKYYSLRAKRGPKRAIVAVAHGLLRAVYVVLETGNPYAEPAPLPISEIGHTRKTRQLCAQLRNMGFEVTLNPKQQTA